MKKTEPPVGFSEQIRHKRSRRVITNALIFVVLFTMATLEAFFFSGNFLLRWTMVLMDAAYLYAIPAGIITHLWGREHMLLMPLAIRAGFVATTLGFPLFVFIYLVQLGYPDWFTAPTMLIFGAAFGWAIFRLLFAIARWTGTPLTPKWLTGVPDEDENSIQP